MYIEGICQSLDFLAEMQFKKLKISEISSDVLACGLWCHGKNQLCQQGQATSGEMEDAPGFIYCLEPIQNGIQSQAH